MLEKINNKSKTNLLPGVKLGLEIRDECWETSIALEETIDFIKHTISSDDIDDNNFSIENGNLLESNCSKYQKAKSHKEKQNRIIAVIGPGGSTVTINVQNLLQLFEIPHLGYSATSRDLSDKKMYKKF
jgi:metabotropic glutamate receptor 1